MIVTGYLHPRYAESLCEFGEPLHLPRSGGWLLMRRVDSNRADAMSAYPLFACLDWKSLKSDIDQLAKSLVSVVVVTDPFGDYDEALLRESFCDLQPPLSHTMPAIYAVRSIAPSRSTICAMLV